MVERVFLGEKIFQPRITGQGRLMEKADITPSTKLPKGAVFVTAAQGDGANGAVRLPLAQCVPQRAHHVQAQRIERLGPRQGNHSDASAHLGVHKL